LYTARASHGSFAFFDPWPKHWSEEYDKRPRSRNFENSLIRADAMPIPTRLRQLQKAGALIAAEMDRLIRRLEAGTESDE
jgi:hypothetical protein